MTPGTRDAQAHARSEAGRYSGGQSVVVVVGNYLICKIFYEAPAPRHAPRVSRSASNPGRPRDTRPVGPRKYSAVPGCRGATSGKMGPAGAGRKGVPCGPGKKKGCRRRTPRPETLEGKSGILPWPRRSLRPRGAGRVTVSRRIPRFIVHGRGRVSIAAMD